MCQLIFFVYLYQRWIYPIDKKRVNEFGQEFEETVSEDGNLATNTPTQLKEGGEGEEGSPADVSGSREDVLTDDRADTLSPYEKAEELEELVKPKSGKSGSDLQKRTKRSKA
jgi:hypothetical protein